MNAKQRTEEKVFSFMEEHNMLKATDLVVAGVSGGADSVCLLFVLLEYRKRVPFSLAVVHVNHGIRQEAGQDMDYVEQLCREHEIPFYPFLIDVRAMARQDKCSEEEAGRNARYDAFHQVAEKIGATKIAVAHNSNDRSETMLFHLFRGSGIKGLGSIRPVRDRIIRPILCLERKEVEAYLEERRIAYCQDATNEEDDYTRNRIRHHILPYAEREIVSGCVAHMAQTADILAETEDYLEQQTEAAMKECVNGNIIDVDLFLGQHKVIRQRILYKIVMSLTDSGRDISYIHIKSLMSLFAEKANRSVDLPFGIVGRREYDRVAIERKLERSEDREQATELNIPCKVPIGEGGELELMVVSAEGILEEFPTSPYTKWFDYDKIEQSLVLRKREIGDYMTIKGKNGILSHKSVKDYMIDLKIPKKERDKIYLLADGQHVVWLIGYRISEYYKINRNTKRILQVQLVGKGCVDSRTEDKNGRTC